MNAREQAIVLRYRDHRNSTRLWLKVVTVLRVELDYLGIDGPVRHILHRADPK